MSRTMLYCFIAVAALLTALAFVRINGVVRAATVGTWGTYVPVATEACPSVPSVGFCPPILPEQSPRTITPSREPVVVPPGGDV